MFVWFCIYGFLMGMHGRNCEAIRKELNLDFIVAADRSAIVATIEPVLEQIFLSRQSLQTLSRQLSRQKL